MEDISKNILEIQSLNSIREKLEYIIDENSNDELKDIYNSVVLYIKNNCPHYFIHDYIDIDCDKSMQINYCKYCFMKKENQ